MENILILENGIKHVLTKEELSIIVQGVDMFGKHTELQKFMDDIPEFREAHKRLKSLFEQLDF